MPELSSEAFARCEIEPNADLADLLDKPTRLEATAIPGSSGDESTMHTVFDYHAVYPVSVAEFAAVLKDHRSQVARDSRVVASTVRCRSSLPNGSYKQLELGLRFSALGFTRTYDYVVDLVSRWHHDGERFSMGWELRESLDGRLISLKGSWFLATVAIDGTPHTYVRYFAASTETNPLPGTAIAVRLFADGDMRRRMHGVYEAASKLAALR